MTKMYIDHTVVEKALEFLDAEFGWSPGEAPRIDALRAALHQQMEPVEPVAWLSALKDAFFEGFTSVATYNDTLLNSPEEAWEKYKPPRVAQPSNQCAETCVRAKLCATCAQALAVHAEPVSKMTTHRAIYFMERFKREEKLLGPNEQAALDFVISMLEKQAALDQQHPVVWGVDWGSGGDLPCVSIVKKQADGSVEIVAVRYGPADVASPQKIDDNS